jgi:hypothetical protein
MACLLTIDRSLAGSMYAIIFDLPNQHSVGVHPSDVSTIQLSEHRYYSRGMCCILTQNEAIALLLETHTHSDDTGQVCIALEFCCALRKPRKFVGWSLVAVIGSVIA